MINANVVVLHNSIFIYFGTDVDLYELRLFCKLVNELPFGITLFFIEQNESGNYFCEMLSIIRDKEKLEIIFKNIIDFYNTVKPIIYG